MKLAPDTGPDWLRPVLAAWQRGGWIGVDLFFVLSGFLVSGLLFSEFFRYGDVQPWRFLGRRGFKIYPGFYVLLLYGALIMSASGNPVRSVEVASEAVFVQNYGPSLYNYTWSLAVEEHFYIALALGLALLTRRRGHVRDVPRIVLALLLGTLAARIVTAGCCLADRPSLVHWTHLRLDALSFGVLLGYWAHTAHDRFVQLVTRFRAPILAASVLLVLPSALRSPIDPFVAGIGLSLLYLGFGGLLAVAFCSRLPGVPPVALSAVAAIGVNSYSIYLWHVPVREWGGRLLALIVGQPGLTLPGLALYVAASLAAGHVAFLLVERPFLRLRDRYVPPRSPALTVAPPAVEVAGRSHA
jgi:peptidoglycan/LPS O-acetylase OafA/YrhL